MPIVPAPSAMGDVTPILDQLRACLRSERRRCEVGGIEIVSRESNVSAERTHALNLQWIRCDTGKDRERQATLASGVGHPLTEVASGRTDETRMSVQGRGQILRSAPFERADGIQRLDLDHQAAVELFLQGLCPELRRVEKHRVDHGGSVSDAVD